MNASRTMRPRVMSDELLLGLPRDLPGFLRRFGVEVEFYHASATVAELEGHFKDNTRVLYIESPGQSLRVAGIDWECTYMMASTSVCTLW